MMGTDRARPREQGSALFVTMLMLVLMGLIGFAALETVTRDQQVAHFVGRKAAALYAAEAGIAQAIDTLQNEGTPSVPTTSLGDTSLYPHGQPSYKLDPDAATPVEDLGIAGVAGMNLAIGSGGPTFIMKYYRVRVEGEALGGSTSKLEVAAGLMVGS
jgi:Tfp pilus assembly protein PilX